MNPIHLRDALVAHFDKTITPEVAARIFELALAPVDHSIDPSRFEPEWHCDYGVRVESLRSILPELHGLHVRHWQETEKHRHGLPLNPDYLAMRADERAGNLLQFTVRTRDHELVGNLRMYLGVSRHSGTRFAQEDTLFISPEHRGGLLPLRLMRYAERTLLALGVREIRADSKLINRADVLMRRMGYTPVATKFVKVFEAQASQEADHVH
jgi:hypothetical protein